MSNDNTHVLPPAFADLEQFLPSWSLSTERERKERRATATMLELRNYYEKVQPRMVAIAEHLNHFEYQPAKLPTAERHLLQLAYIFMETAMTMEFYHMPEPEGAFPRNRFVIEDIKI